MSKNLATTTIASHPGPPTSATSVTVATGTGSRLFVGAAVIHPADAVPTAANAEVVSITDVTGDVVTIVRAQESSAARAIVTGDILTQGITAAMWDTLVSSNAGKAAASHVHSAADVTSGTLPLARGGTGGTDAATARTSLGLGAAATMTPATIAADPALTAMYAPLPPTRRGCYTFGSDATGTAFVGVEVVTRLRFTPHATTTRWRIRHQGVVGGGAVCGGLYVGRATYSASTGAVQSATVAAPVQYHGAYTVPDSAQYVGPWVADPALQFAAGLDYIVSFGLTGTGGESRTYQAGRFDAWSTGGASGFAALAAQQAPAGLLNQSVSYTGFIIEFETVDVRKVVLWVGDSLTEGQSASFDSAALQWARRSGHIAIVNGFSGFQSVAFGSAAANVHVRTNPTEQAIDYAVVLLGANDIVQNSVALATYQTRMIAALAAIRTATGKADLPIHLCTIPPIALAGGATLTADAPIGATAITANKSVSTGAFTINAASSVGSEAVTVSSVTGTGPYTLNLSGPLTKLHTEKSVIASGNELLRQQYNGWIRSAPMRIASVLDFDAVLASPGDQTVLDSRVSFDGVHYTARGHSRTASLL